MENQPIVFGNYTVQEKINGDHSYVLSWEGKIDEKWILGVHFTITKSNTGKVSFHPSILFKEDGEKSFVTFKEDKVSIPIPGPSITLYHGKVLRIQGFDINPFKPIPVIWKEEEGFKKMISVYNQYHQKG